MRKALKVRKAALVVSLVSLMSLGLASTAFAGPVSGGKQANSACSLNPQVAKNEPGICSSQPIGSVESQRRPATPTSSSGLDPMWFAVAGMVAAAVIAGTTLTLYRHKPHPIA